MALPQDVQSPRADGGVWRATPDRELHQEIPHPEFSRENNLVYFLTPTFEKGTGWRAHRWARLARLIHPAFQGPSATTGKEFSADISVVL
jgi:hypothetical protein